MKGKGKKLFAKLGSSKDDTEVERKLNICVTVLCLLDVTNVFISTSVEVLLSMQRSCMHDSL